MKRNFSRYRSFSLNPKYRKPLFIVALVFSMAMVLAYIAGLDEDPRHAIAGLSCFTSLMCMQILSIVKQQAPQT
jgi:hypothetical protein